VTTNDVWFPIGFRSPAEAELDKADRLLPGNIRSAIGKWWLDREAGTPKWDLVSTAQFGKDRGVVLVEAKAHEDEICNDQCKAKEPNRSRIKEALAEASTEWNRLVDGVTLTAGSYFQLSNRFAFAWKLAQLGVPVALIYLGFLDAHEMGTDERTLLEDHPQWRRCVTTRASSAIPAAAWDRTYRVNGRTTLSVAIRSATVNVEARVVAHDAVPGR
jgi:hypothetical protein